MRSYKIHKIDLSSEYPCPCRRRKGNLKPIVLTEALGCDRCQQIFVVKKDGQVIEQLSSIYQKKSWQWTGSRWKNAYDRWRGSYLSTMAILAVALAALGIIILFLLRWLSVGSIISGAVLLAIIILLVLTLFVVYRH